MSLVTTHSGRQVDLRGLTAADIALEDVAHGLSNVCRWMGQVGEFLSVAQHACMTFDLVRDQTAVPVTHKLLRTALHHDTPEVYLGDMPAPLKLTAWAAPYRELEADVWRACVQRFELLDPLPSVVEHADLVLRATEARDLMHGLVLPGLPDPLPIPGGLRGWWYRAAVVPWAPWRARREFLRRYAAVTTVGDWLDVRRVA